MSVNYMEDECVCVCVECAGYKIKYFSHFLYFNQNTLPKIKIYLISLFSVSTFLTLISAAEELIDTREGEDLTLKCRFNEQQSKNEFSYYWARSAGANFENVAIGDVQLNTNYRYTFLLINQPPKTLIDIELKLYCIFFFIKPFP